MNSSEAYYFRDVEDRKVIREIITDKESIKKLEEQK
jgi:hypothetical protein